MVRYASTGLKGLRGFAGRDSEDPNILCNAAIAAGRILESIIDTLAWIGREGQVRECNRWNGIPHIVAWTAALDCLTGDIKFAGMAVHEALVSLTDWGGCELCKCCAALAIETAVYSLIIRGRASALLRLVCNYRSLIEEVLVVAFAVQRAVHVIALAGRWTPAWGTHRRYLLVLSIRNAAVAIFLL